MFSQNSNCCPYSNHHRNRPKLSAPVPLSRRVANCPFQGAATHTRLDGHGRARYSNSSCSPTTWSGPFAALPHSPSFFSSNITNRLNTFGDVGMSTSAECPSTPAPNRGSGASSPVGEYPEATLLFSTLRGAYQLRNQLTQLCCDHYLDRVSGQWLVLWFIRTSVMEPA